MAFDFPTAPAVDDEYTSGGVTYKFNGTGWIVIPEIPLLPIAATQCRLILSAPNLLLIPHNGNMLTIDSVGQLIPDGGVPLPYGGHTIGVMYYIYAYMNGATMALDYGSDAPVIQAGTGLWIKPGDPTRTLVGAAVPGSSPTAWVDQDGARLTRSWFNEKPFVSTTIPAGITSAGVWNQWSGSTSNYFCSWANELWQFHLTGRQLGGAMGLNMYNGIGLSGVPPTGPNYTLVYATVANYHMPLAVSGSYVCPAGQQYFSAYGWASSSAGNTCGATLTASPVR